jgi:hypothetical protein
MCVSVPVTLVRRSAQGKTRNDWHRPGRPAPESFTLAMYDTAHLAATGFRGGCRPQRISSRHIFSGSSRLSSSSRRVSPAETHCSLPIVSVPSYTCATLHSLGQTRGKCFFCVSKTGNQQKFIFLLSNTSPDFRQRFRQGTRCGKDYSQTLALAKASALRGEFRVIGPTYVRGAQRIQSPSCS